MSRNIDLHNARASFSSQQNFLNPGERISYSRETDFLFRMNGFLIPGERISYSGGTDFLFQGNGFLIPGKRISYSRGTDFLFRMNGFLIPDERISYSGETGNGFLIPGKRISYSHNIIVKLNSCSCNYIGVRVRLGLGFVGQRGEVRVRFVELSAPCKN